MNASDRVLIAGGGPAGMAAALFLTARGVPVTVLERGLTPHDDPRAATYHPPSLEMLEPSGVTAELHEPHEPNHRLLAARTASLVDFHTRNAEFYAAFDSKDDTP